MQYRCISDIIWISPFSKFYEFNNVIFNSFWSLQSQQHFGLQQQNIHFHLSCFFFFSIFPNASSNLISRYVGWMVWKLSRVVSSSNRKLGCPTYFEYCISILHVRIDHYKHCLRYSSIWYKCGETVAMIGNKLWWKFNPAIISNTLN